MSVSCDRTARCYNPQGHGLNTHPAQETSIITPSFRALFAKAIDQVPHPCKTEWNYTFTYLRFNQWVTTVRKILSWEAKAVSAILIYLSLCPPFSPPPHFPQSKTCLKQMLQIYRWVGVIVSVDSKLLTVPRICICFQGNRIGVSSTLCFDTI
jgi:hypothetical protein